MTLIVEDGTGLSDAESYLSVSDADTYHINRGNASWASETTENKEIALRNATEYLDITYCWEGVIYSDTQALGWPRTEATDKEGRSLDNLVPKEVENATAELALTALTANLLPDKTNSDYIKREKVGDLEVEYKDSSISSTDYSKVSRMLNGLYESVAGSSQVKLVRV